MTSYEASGKTLDEAIRAGLTAMDVERDAVSVEVLEKPKNGFFGFGGTPARVKLTLTGIDLKETAPPPSPAKAAQKPKKEFPPRKDEAPRKADAPRKDDLPRKENAARQPQQQAQPRPAKTPVSASAPAPAPRAEGRSKPERASSPATPEQEKTALDFVSGLMLQMKTGATATSGIDGDGVINITLDGDNLGGLIGRRGDTLDAIQYLTAHVINRGAEQMCRVHVDAANYRAKRKEALKRLAIRSAENTVRYRNNSVLEPMNAFERHIIHATLQDFAGVTTYSQGTEPQRRVVISYQGGARGYAPRSGSGGPRRSGAPYRDGPRRDAVRAPSAPAPAAAPHPAPAAPVTAAPAPAVPAPAVPPAAAVPKAEPAPVKRGLPVKEFGSKREG